MPPPNNPQGYFTKPSATATFWRVTLKEAIKAQEAEEVQKAATLYRKLELRRHPQEQLIAKRKAECLAKLELPSAQPN